ncbi:metalloregulator ArsR/SmtB family transcription factor [soil metagenome]
MELAQYVDTLTLLGDESRLRLCALLRERELSVTDLLKVTGISQSRVSTHLARLREAGFVRDRRDAQHAYYSLAEDTLPGTAKTVLDGLATANAQSDPTLEGDRRRLAELLATPKSRLPFADEVSHQYSPGRTWQSLSFGFAALLRLGDVLDVGTGDGAVANFIAPYCKSLTCIDTAPRMVDAARARLANRAHAHVELADVPDLPFGDLSFAAVLLFHTLAYADNPARAVEQCARVLRPGGRLVLLSLEEHAHRELTAAYGEIHQGFSARRIKSLFTRAHLGVIRCDVACREAKKPHFQTLLAIGERPSE